MTATTKQPPNIKGHRSGITVLAKYWSANTTVLPMNAPQSVPLPPMMAELPFEVVDVLEEEPDRLHTIDTGEFKEDMD